jgi:hypothetical protein
MLSFSQGCPILPVRHQTPLSQMVRCDFCKDFVELYRRLRHSKYLKSPPAPNSICYAEVSEVSCDCSLVVDRHVDQG